MPPEAPWIAVVGAGRASPEELAVAEEVGAEIAAAGAVLVCGGLGGVMEAACRGARSRGGRTVGLLPGLDRGEANGWVEVAVPTGLGEARNALIVRAADAIVAVGGRVGDPQRDRPRAQGRAARGRARHVGAVAGRGGGRGHLGNG